MGTNKRGGVDGPLSLKRLAPAALIAVGLLTASAIAVKILERLVSGFDALGFLVLPGVVIICIAIRSSIESVKGRYRWLVSAIRDALLAYAITLMFIWLRGCLFILNEVNRACRY